MERVNLLVCDLDGTLLGNEPALAEFANWYRGTNDCFRLAYASGRFVESVRESIKDSLLPEPDAIIGGVGTQIYDVAAARRMAMWPPSLFEWNPYEVRAVCTAYAELVPQPDPLLSYHKVSYYAVDLNKSFLDTLEDQLAAAGQRVTTIYSSNRDLDILPADTNKGSAVAHLARRWKIDPRRVIVAGDSGNDLAMFAAGFRGIIVGNSQHELLSLKTANVYHALAPFAGGVLEGLGYWLATDDFAITDGQ
jgi:mannosylfructose-6-phosphate phosphatase